MTSFNKAEIVHLDNIKSVLIAFIDQNGKKELTWDIACNLVNYSLKVERQSNLYICKAWSDLTQ